ncbi:MAG: MAPEG family protein [Sphingobium sp.]|nr:MAPEG family protein [Sphingobium sp.]
MAFELKILVWGCVLGLVHIFAAGQAKTRQYGRDWNVSARDAELPPPPSPVVGRLMRAQANYFETFPIAALLLLIAGLVPSSSVTPWGASLWFGARLVYLPLYAFGVPVVRTLVWGVSFVGILLLLWPPLAASFS